MQLEELVGRVASPDRLPTLTRDDLGVHHEVVEPIAYVHPEVSEQEHSAENPAVLLISAPAAVGKSMLARYLAAATGNPLWDLGRFRVGSNFFTGTMARAYGGRGYADFEQLLQAGEATVVIDAADEALVRAGLGNYEEALSDLADVLGTAGRPHAAAVILGRPETLEITAVVLTEQDVGWELLEIEFFDEERSRELIAKRYEALRDTTAPAQGIEAFSDAIFEKITSGLDADHRTWDSPELRSFLGYAPVLDALAGLAAVSGNPFGEAQRLRAEASPESLWTLLRDIIYSICSRESEKLANNFADGDSARLEIGREAYSVDEQVRLLLSPSSDDVDVRVPTGFREDWTDELVVSVRQQLREHPFLRFAGAQRPSANPLMKFANAAFRDFVAARALGHAPKPTAEAAAGFYADPTLNPSPLLVRLFTADPPANAINPVALGPLVDSASTRLARGREMRVHIEERTPDLMVDTEDADIPDVTTLAVTIHEDDRLLGDIPLDVHEALPLRITRQIRNIFMDAPSSTVILGSGVRDFSITAPSYIRAATIAAEADDVRVGGSGSAVLEAAGFSTATNRIRVGDNASLVLRVPEAPYPWHQYRAETPSEAPSEAELVGAAMDLRGVASWFLRPSISGGHRYPARAMDTIRRKHRTPEAMFDYCVTVGVITQEGYEYVFEAPFDLARVRELDIRDEKVRAFLDAFIRET